MHPVIAKDYPRAIREAYVGALRKSHASERHQHLLRFGEVSLAHLASLALADYRQARRDHPDEGVENWLAGRTRVTTGQYLELFRITQKALGRPEIFGIKRYEVNAKLDHAARLSAAIGAIDYAQRVGARNVRAAIDEGVRERHKAVRWLPFWTDFVEYRNRIVHADDKGWPIDAEGYFDLMTPFLEAALIEALTTEYIAHVLLEYPVARLTDVTRIGESWALMFDGEYRGAPLMCEVLQNEPPETWQAEVGADYVLGRQADSAWYLYARFWDLKRDSAPPKPLEARGEPATQSVSPSTLWAPPSQPAPHAGPERPIASDPPQSPSPPLPNPVRHHQAPPLPPPPPPRTLGVAPPPYPRTAPSTTDAWFPSFSPWMLWGILSFGLLAPIGFLVAATRIRDTRTRNWGLFYSAITLVILVFAGIKGDSGRYPVLDGLFATLLMAEWAGSTVHAFVINPRIRRERQLT
jgi:hypothetical protein